MPFPAPFPATRAAQIGWQKTETFQRQSLFYVIHVNVVYKLNIPFHYWLRTHQQAFALPRQYVGTSRASVSRTRPRADARCARRRLTECAASEGGYEGRGGAGAAST